MTNKDKCVAENACKSGRRVKSNGYINIYNIRACKEQKQAFNIFLEQSN